MTAQASTRVSGVVRGAPAGQWLAVVVATLVVVAAAAAQTGPAPGGTDETAVKAARDAIMQQLDAFNRGDFEQAYTFASAQIKEMFDRPAFERMVTLGYPEIARSASAVVAEVQRAPSGSLLLLLRIRGANGRAVEAVYEMVLENGQWRINGVVTRPDTSEKAARPGLREGRGVASPLGDR